MTTTATTTTINTTEFEVGAGATHCGWSDRKAGTIIAMTATTITLQIDKATLLNGVDSGEGDALNFEAGGFCGHTSGQQRYEYERDEDGGVMKFTKRGERGFYRVGAKTGGRGGKLIVGRHGHYDFNF